MERSSAKRGMRPSTKIVLLAVFAVVGMGVYSAGWYYLAGQLAGRVEGLIASLSEDGVSLSCDNLDVRGYPFRLGVFCDGITASDMTSGDMNVTTAAFRSAAQIYRPNHVVSELEAPVRAVLANGASLALDWQALQSSTVFGTSGLSRASLQGNALVAQVEGGAIDATADTLQLHTRRNGEDLELAFMLEGARLGGLVAPTNLPSFDFVAEAIFSDGAGFLAGRRLAAEELRGTSGVLSNATAAIDGGGRAVLNGPFEIAEDGLISGAFDLRIERLSDWQALIAAQMPGAEGTIETATGFLRAFGGGGDTISVTLQVSDGRVALGIIPIGRIPPI